MPREIMLFEEAMEGISGFLTNRERGVSVPLARVTEAWDLIYNNTYRGRTLLPHEREFLIREALTTSDFPLLFGDVLDRQVLAAYKAVDPVWKAFTKMSTVKDFKDAYRFAITGGDQYLARVGEKGEYLASERTEDKYTLNVLKYGRQFDVSWEVLINDDLGALKDTPERFARAAVRTEHRLVTNAYARNAVLYVAGRNVGAGALTIANLETGVAAMRAFQDANNEPIMNNPIFLVVPPGLEFTGRQILSSAVKQWVELGGAGGPLPYPTTNVIAQVGLQLKVDPYLAIYGGADLATQWYLFADPKDIAALEAAHLQGYERPEICMKASDKVSIGGGDVGPLSGDFATDNVFYRVRLVFGVTRLDWRATYMGGSSL